LELVMITSGGAIHTPPSGWNSVSALSAAGNGSASLRAATRIAQIGDANAPVTFTIDANARWAVALIVIYDDAGGVPRIEQVTTSGSGGQTLAPSTPAVDPVNVDNLLLAVFGGITQANGGIPTLTAAGGYTLEGQNSSTSATLKNATIGVAPRILTNGDPVAAATHASSLSIAPAGASILISSHNTAPTANAGPDQSVNPGATVALNGSASADFDGSISSYAWQQISGPAVTLSNAAVAQPTFSAPSSVTASVLVFGLTVTDNEGTSSTQDTVTINVAATPYQHVWNGTTMVKRQVRHWVNGTWS
jgi:hypothetical protein